MTTSGTLFVVSAPSGAGKTSLVKGLIEGGDRGLADRRLDCKPEAMRPA